MAYPKQELDAAPRLPATTFQILLELAGGARHGYSILREITQTHPELRLGPATLYRTIKQLLDKGWIVETESQLDPALDDERRRYYQLTDDGRRAAQIEAQRLAEAVTEAQQHSLLPAPAEQPSRSWRDKLVMPAWMPSLHVIRPQDHKANPAHDEEVYEDISASVDPLRTRRRE